jgi:hypothetical protein
MRRKGFAIYHRDFKWYAALSTFTFGNTVVEATPCAYCGMPAETEDHVIPITFYQAGMDAIQMSHWRFSLVPACRECNVLASNFVFDTVSKKRRFIQERLKCRYRKILAIPFWDEDEIESLSEDFARYVKHGLKLKEIISRRINYRGQRARSAEKHSPPIALGSGTVQRNAGIDTTRSGYLPVSGFCEGDGI